MSIETNNFENLWAEGFSDQDLKRVKKNRFSVLPKKTLLCVLAVICMLIGVTIICVSIFYEYKRTFVPTTVEARVLEVEQVLDDKCAIEVAYKELNEEKRAYAFSEKCPAIGEVIDVDTSREQNYQFQEVKVVNAYTIIKKNIEMIIGISLIFISCVIMWLILNDLRIALMLSTVKGEDIKKVKIIGILKSGLNKDKALPIYLTSEQTLLKDYEHYQSISYDELKALVGKEVEIAYKEGYFLLLDHVFRAQN